MTPKAFSEDVLVQETSAEYLREELGWEVVYAHNKESFGAEGLLGRDSAREVVLRVVLRERLEALNPGLPGVVYEEGVRCIVEVDAAQGIELINREKYGLLRDGVSVSFRDGKGEQRRERLRVFDFEEPENNRFLCVRELVVQGDLYQRRADLVGFVNGLPLLFVECKNIQHDLRVAFERNYLDYRDTVPQLFHYNAVVMFGNGDRAKIGSITSQWEHFQEWKRLAEEEPGAVDMETLLKGVCAKGNFLDLLENFILFDESSGAVRKILARNHQFLGVNLCVEAVRRRKELDGKLGVFWHTQGAGKSYSMVMFTRKVHRKLGGNFSFLVLTDREDLDAQIYKTFAGCGVVNHDRDPCRAADGRHLHRLLGEQKSHIFSLIQKFNRELAPGQSYTERDDIIVMSDEAHRTQHGTLAANMRQALPNAGYIGFTGTPLFKEDQITRRVFGGYISTYDFLRAVQDEATVPLYYDSRGEKLRVAIGDLNERVAEKLEQLEIEDVDVAQRLELALKRDYHIITAGKRLDQIARDLVEHYTATQSDTAVEQSGKAMLVCIDKLTCVRMYELIHRYWEERTAQLQLRCEACAAGPRKEELRRQLAWMRETRIAVVVSEEQGEVERFRGEGLDIRPHRKLIKEGMDLPQSMRAEPQFRHMQRMDLDEAFKEEQHPFRLAIVCAMWLTGFDVPSLATLYLDKPLKEHTLMQAIARANRVHSGKSNGMIVDYCGILKHLRKALATFAGTQPDGKLREIDPVRPPEELLAELEEAIALVRTFLAERGAPLDAVIQAQGFTRNAAIRDCKDAANENDETRKRFELLCRVVLMKFRACINIPQVRQYRADRDAIDIVYRKLREDREKADISDIMQQLRAIANESIDVQSEIVDVTPQPYDISKIDFDLLQREFARHPAQRTAIWNLMRTIEQRLRRMLQQNPLRTDLQKHYEQLVAAYNREKDRVTIEQTFAELLRFTRDLDKELNRAVREGLDEESMAVFDLLKKPELSKDDIKRIKKVATALLQKLKTELRKMHQWRDKEKTRGEVYITIRDFLWDPKTGLPDSYQAEELKPISKAVFRHIRHAYPSDNSPFFQSTVAA